MPDDLPFDSADGLEIDHDALADEATHRRDQSEPAGRDVDALARVFLAAREHVAAKHHERDAAMPAPIERPGGGLNCCASLGLHG
jgi:hypothetical protein